MVLGRELSLGEIARIAADTDMPLECFVHGALCVSYSGQCFSSEAWGGRSANRGQCAQACRLPYGLLVDGELRARSGFDYLLSPQDLMALTHLPQLLAAGVRSLKIEGRLKGPEYVAATVRAYREALDNLAATPGEGRAEPATLPVDLNTRRALAQVFSRGQGPQADGLTPGFLEGPRHPQLVIGRNPRHRGLCLGEVVEVTDRGVGLVLRNPVKRGDGVVFDAGDPMGREPGGNIYALLDAQGRPLDGETDRGHVTLQFGRDFPLYRVAPGQLIWRTKDAAMDGGLHARRATRRRLAVSIAVKGSVGTPLRLTMRDRQGREVVLETAVLQPAQNRPLSPATLAGAIGTLGDTPFTLDDLTVDIPQNGFLPTGEIKAARRQLVADFIGMLQRHQRSDGLLCMASVPAVIQELAARPAMPPGAAAVPRISLLCRNLAQVEAALEIDWLDEVQVDFLEVHGLKSACEQVRASGRRLVVAAPRILKPGEARLRGYLLSLEPDALLVRSAGLLHALQRLANTEGVTLPELYGDFSLNATNQISARTLLDSGLARLTPGHDLNAAQLAALADGMGSDAARLELVMHQHLPVFHTEHCVFARFLSAGNSHRDCGRPCERHRVHLRDPAGKDHLLQADVGCRNTLFNAEAQSAAAHIHPLLAAGLRHFRIEFVDESAADVSRIAQGYRALLQGGTAPEPLLAMLGRVTDANQHPQGVGPGSLAVRVELAKPRMKRPTAR